MVLHYYVYFAVDAAATNAYTGDEPPVVSQNIVTEEIPSVVDEQAAVSTGAKRKSIPRRSTRKTPSDVLKKAKPEVNQNEENGALRTLKDHISRSKVPTDLHERKLLLEERKLNLAEKRFQLEEKKLGATIEIGKGLIASMERMTQTISGLGSFSAL